MTVADDLATLLHYGYIAAGVVVRRRNEVKDAHGRVEAEIARLERERDEAERLFDEETQHLTAMERRAEAAEAEIARLRGGLRRIAGDADQWCEAQCGEAARALLDRGGR